MKLVALICFTMLSIGASAFVSLNDTIDPIIPEYLFSQDVCGDVSLVFPPIIPAEEGFFTVTLIDSSGNSMNGVEILITIGNSDIGFVEYNPIMTGAFTETFQYPITGFSILDLESNFGSSTDYVIIENCLGVIYEGLLSEVPTWGMSPGCLAEPEFYGYWSICDGPGSGTFDPLSQFSTVFNPESVGVYTLCFQSSLTDSIYEFVAHVKELGCPDPAACNYTSSDDCDFGGCIYNCSDCDNYIEGPVFFADGFSISYQDTIQVESGTEGEIIDSVDDLNSFWLSIEHSYLGDLEITYVCPNGQSLTVHHWEDGGGGTFLGEPIDDGTNNIGICYTYYFVDFSGNGTMGNIDLPTIPSAGYTSSDPWEYLLGCPVNGNWSLEVHDFLALDNGYICGWGVYFDSDVLTEDCQNVVTSGCQDPEACNYNSEASIDDMSCAYPGCTDPLACNFNPLAGCDSGTCIFAGCEDATACNYNAFAGCDDGSCIYPGCTDSLACNFNLLAGCEDGNCEYTSCIEYVYTAETTQNCDFTWISYSVSSIEPAWAIATYSIPGQGYSQNIIADFEYSYMLVEGGDYPAFLEIEMSSNQSGNVSIQVDNIGVVVNPEEPELSLWETTLFCGNCSSSQNFEWFIDGGFVSNESSIEIIGMADYQLCLVEYLNGEDCSVCSQPFIIENIPTHFSRQIEIYGNGTSSPSFIMPERDLFARLYDLTGKLIKTYRADQSDEIEIFGFPSGQYVLRINEVAVLVEILE